MGMEELRRIDPNSSDPSMGYGSSHDGNANDQLPIVELSELLRDMDADGFGMSVGDSESRAIDQPTAPTIIDEQFEELGEPRHD